MAKAKATPEEPAAVVAAPTGPRRVIIEHKDGRSYSVPVGAALDEYIQQGFKALHYEDGEPYKAKE